MNTVLIEPTDVLFFRDAIPMSAGQGKGAGCRLPFPSTLHEAFRASLLRARGEVTPDKRVAGRPRDAMRKGNWHEANDETDVRIATKAFCSLRSLGPFPWHPEKKLLLPVPLDVALSPDRSELARLQLSPDPDVVAHRHIALADLSPICLPVAVTPPDKHAQLHGWWSVAQFHDYLSGELANNGDRFRPTPTECLWQPEHRIGVQIDPGSFAAARGQLYVGSYLRPKPDVRFVAGTHLGDPRGTEDQELRSLPWLLLGGEFRLARLWHQTETGQPLPDCFARLRQAPTAPPGEGPCLLKWVLITPAIFAHGSLPGWCWNETDGRPAGEVRLAASKRKPKHESLPGRAQLISWCIGRPRTVSGFDVVEGRAKPTLLAVPEGGVYYFLCENRATACALAQKLHWQPRSDFYGEKGCGYGLVSFDVQMHPNSPPLAGLAKEVFG